MKRIVSSILSINLSLLWSSLSTDSSYVFFFFIKCNFCHFKIGKRRKTSSVQMSTSVINCYFVCLFLSTGFFARLQIRPIIKIKNVIIKLNVGMTTEMSMKFFFFILPSFIVFVKLLAVDRMTHDR